MSPAIAIVGPGAIGTTVAAALHESGHTPVLCGRSAWAGLELRRGEAVIAIPGPVHTDPAGVGAPVDLVFLAVKTTQLATAGTWLEVLCGTETVVCVLQNGIEQVSDVSPLTRGAPVVPAVVWFPAEREPDGGVQLHGEARLTLPDTAPAGLIRDVLADSWCTVELSADFLSLAWRKLLMNAAAGLMALSGRRLGIYGRDDISRLTIDYLQECLAVARAEGAQLDDDLPDQILAGFRASAPDRGTSILADRLSGQPLEWDTRNGIVSRRARHHGMVTPLADAVSALLAAASDGPG